MIREIFGKCFLRLHYLALRNVLQFPLPHPWSTVMSISSEKDPNASSLMCVLFEKMGVCYPPLILLRKMHKFIHEIPLFCRRGCRVWICQALPGVGVSSSLFIFDAPIPILSIELRKEHVFYIILRYFCITVSYCKTTTKM